LVAALYGCIFKGKLYSFALARDIRYSRYGVGHLHQMHAIKDAIGRDLTEYDFLQGDEPYKFYWTKSVRRYMRITIIKGGFLSGLRLQLLRVFLRLWDVRQYSVREICAILSIRRREKEELERMGLAEQLDRLRRSCGGIILIIGLPAAPVICLQVQQSSECFGGHNLSSICLAQPQVNWPVWRSSFHPSIPLVPLEI